MRSHIFFFPVFFKISTSLFGFLILMPVCFNSPQAPFRLSISQHREIQAKWLEFDKVVSNFKTTFILYTISPLFCIPGFMKQRQRKMKWQSAEICRHTCDLLQITEVCNSLDIIFNQHRRFLFPRDPLFIGRTNFFTTQHNTTLSPLYYGQHYLKGKKTNERKRDRISNPAKVYCISPNILFGKRSSPLIHIIKGKLKAEEGSEFPK